MPQVERCMRQVFECNWVHTDEIPVKKLLEEESLTPDLIDSVWYLSYQMICFYVNILSYALLCLIKKWFAIIIEISGNVRRETWWICLRKLWYKEYWSRYITDFHWKHISYSWTPNSHFLLRSFRTNRYNASAILLLYVFDSHHLYITAFLSIFIKFQVGHFLRFRLWLWIIF